ncbi:MAG: flagellar motor switch protein FliM [Cellulosilyticaceae bacterium]
MSEILSQSEIDDLFKALTTGELDVNTIKDEGAKKVIKAYDFTRPSKFSKEQLRTLEIISESYARLVATYLSGYLRNLVSVEVINAEAITYSEFTNALNNPIILAITDFAPLDGSVLLELSTNMGYAIIDRVLGGAGRGMNKLRDFTDIEHLILERLFAQFAELLIEPWENVIELSPVLEKIETNSQVAQIISPNEIVALVTFSLRIGNVEGMLNLCIPHIVIEPIMDKLNTKYWFSQNEKQKNPIYEKHLEQLVEKAHIPIRAELGKTHITISEFLQLQPMDIIKLDKDIEADVNVYVGNLLKFHGKPGVYKNKAAIQIKEVVVREDE